MLLPWMRAPSGSDTRNSAARTTSAVIGSPFQLENSHAAAPNENPARFAKKSFAFNI